jgi:tRNA A37 threonylcarbamoyladenosine dehydratase
MTQKTNIDISKTIQQIGNDAVREAQRKNLENGIPNVYSKNGVLYFQLPDGTITMDNPFEKGELKERLDALTSVS